MMHMCVKLPCPLQLSGYLEDRIFSTLYGASRAGTVTRSLNHTQWIVNPDKAGKNFTITYIIRNFPIKFMDGYCHGNN